MWEAGLDAYGKQHVGSHGKKKWAATKLEKIEPMQKFMPRIDAYRSGEAAPQALTRPPPAAPAESSDADVHRLKSWTNHTSSEAVE